MLKQIKTNMAGNQARIQALSHPRLSNYRSFFGATDDAQVTELLNWLSPDVAAVHLLSELHLRCLHLLQPATLIAYQRIFLPAEIDLTHIANMKNLRKILRYAARRRQPLILKDGHHLVGCLTCAT